MNWPPGGFPKREDTTKLILKTTGAGTKPDPKVDAHSLAN
jgi:hypothetical protein